MSDNIDISAKTDRELLIMVVDKLNGLCGKVVKLDKTVHGNGKPGLQTHVLLLWVSILIIAFGGTEAISLVFRTLVK